MKILDKYVAKNFLIGYCIAFCVLIGLRVVIDLFVSLDEFTEHADLGALAVVRNILTYYGLNSTLYFRDFAGMITVVAAAFSLGKMVRSNEFVAMMASGVSLKRVIASIVFLSILLTAVLVVIDQEFVIPPLGDKLVRDKDDIPGRESYNVRFIADGSGSLIFSQRFDTETSTLYNPTILTRRKVADSPILEPTGCISAQSATYNPQTGKWDLVGGELIEKDSNKGAEPIVSYSSDLTPKDIPLRRQSEYKTLLSWSQLAALQAQGPAKDLAQLYSQKHFRVTDPIINLVMLMLCLPILVCRDPKSMKSAVMISFAVVGVCLITTFVCKMLATEVVFNRVRPELWAWLPVFVFLPVAFMELDSMKT
ncbi:MAG TPA: LptF/LptG family permease [Sedimentisphaerales bacterium]|nr:LptF/LptG family permease [Sedimentisphaerales bacterium]